VKNIADHQWADSGTSLFLQGNKGPSAECGGNASGQCTSEVLREEIREVVV
jgi:hypothetical protein